MARYADAVRWIATNDDEILGSEDTGGFIVSIHLVADLFGKDVVRVHADVLALRRRVQGKPQRRRRAGTR